MNIIKHGHTPRVYYAECKECGCEFTFTKNDVEYDDGESTNYKTCTLQCPECRNTIFRLFCDKEYDTAQDMFLIKYLDYTRNLEYMRAREYE